MSEAVAMTLNPPAVLDSADFADVDALRAELTKTAAAQQPRLLLLAANELAALRQELAADSSLDFLLKPVHPDVLQARLSKLEGTACELHAQREALRQARSRLDQLSFYDGITQLPNSEFFRRHLDLEIHHARRHDRKLAVLAVDLQCARLTDGLLSPEGTREVLRQAGARLVENLRGYDLVGPADDPAAEPLEHMVSRVDGDRFLVLISEFTRVRHVSPAISRLLDGFETPMHIDGEAIQARPRIGVSVFPTDGDDAGGLIRNAQATLSFRPGKDGRRYRFFDARLNRMIQDRHAVERRLRKALEEEAFSLVYQPKVELRSGRPSGFEALLRWHDAELGTVSPSRFIPIAEELGVITEVTRWVLREVCRQSRAWNLQCVPPVPIAVNVSGEDLLRADFPDFVTSTLLDYEVAPQQITLEITEGVVIENLEAAAVMLEELRRIGLTIALDDFGTGYSSLGYLNRMPIDTLKIDRSFIRNMATDWNSAAITSGIITLSHILSLNVVAEGVETQDQLELLQDQNCNEIQGAVFSLGLPADEAAAWLRERS